LGLLNLLQNCVTHKVKKVIFISSGGAVYGEPKDLPVTEDSPTYPLSPYGVSKLVGELYLNFYSKVFGLNYTVLRYSNVYGPRQQGAECGVIAIFLKKILAGETPSIFGDGNQTRDYVFVKDIVEANILALNNGDNGAFNIATSIPTSVNKIFDMVKEVTNFPDSAKNTDPVNGELQDIYLDIKKAKEKLNWSPKTTLEQGLKETYDYFKISH